jgi:hypothetical protein
MTFDALSSYLYMSMELIRGVYIYIALLFDTRLCECGGGSCSVVNFIVDRRTSYFSELETFCAARC